jgi:hypothetical protein
MPSKGWPSLDGLATADYRTVYRMEYFYRWLRYLQVSSDGASVAYPRLLAIRTKEWYYVIPFRGWHKLLHLCVLWQPIVHVRVSWSVSSLREPEFRLALII